MFHILASVINDFIRNDIGYFTFGLVKASVQDSYENRKQKFVMSFAVFIIAENDRILHHLNLFL